MTPELRRLEREVEAGAALLRDLPLPPLSPAVLARTRALVRGEAVRRRGRARWLRRLAGVSSVAAALLLALCWTARPRVVDGAADDAAMAAWATAVSTSGERFAQLVSAESDRAGSDGATSEDELDRWLDVLEQSLEQFEAL